MKNIGNRIQTLGVALAVICSIGSVAFAASSLTTTINGSKATALSTINSEKASAYTTYNGSGAVSVQSTLVSKNFAKGEWHNTTRTKGTYGTVSVTVYKPKADVTMRVTSKHSVSVGNQSWNGTTEKKYGNH